jgi:hypothetical protein
MKPTIFLAALLVLSAFWTAPSAKADERKVLSSIALKQEYSDNLLFTSDSRKSDFISTVSPGLELLNNTDRLKADLKLRLDSLSYMDNSDFNSLDQDYSGAVRYAVSERSNLFTSGGYRRDSRPDRDFTETGLVLEAVDRDQYRFQLGGDYALSEVMGMQLQYSYAEDAYQSAGFTDYQSHGVNCMISRDLSAYLVNTVGRLNLGVTKYAYDSMDVTSYTGTIGAERKLTELYSYFADIGMHYTESVFDVTRLVPTANPFLFLLVADEEQTNGTGLTGRLGISYKGELNDGNLFISHDVQAASGDAGTVERTALQGNIGRKLTENSRIGLSAGYAINKSTAETVATSDTDENSLWIQPKITYALTDKMTVEGSYSYSLIQDNKTGEDRDRNLVMVRLAYQYPLFE